jgi:TolB-like protein/Tfp pilus assembly protein PilF
MAHDKPFIVPVAIDEVSQADARVPERFSELQWTRLPAGETPPAFVARVKALLDTDALASPTGNERPLAGAKIPSAAVESAAAERGPRGLPRTQALIALAVIVIAGLVVLAARVRRGASPVTAPSTMSAADPSMPGSGPAPANPSAPAPAAGVIPEKSIAVLPFVDMSERHDQAYLSDGLAEELLDQLAQVPDLKVASRTSAFYFKDKPAVIDTIAAQLRVANVLEGSVRKSGTTIRVTAQLIRADNGYHLWSMTYDRPAKDVFKVQDDIAAAVVDALKIQLLAGSPATDFRPAKTTTYDHYLIGRHLTDSLSVERMPAAIKEFDQAIALEPNFGPAYSWRAAAEFTLGRDGRDDASVAQAFRDVNRGIELAPRYAQGYQFRAFLRGAHDLDVAGAQADIERALSLDAANSDVLTSYAMVLATRGHLVEAIATAQRAVSLDPLQIISWGNLGTFWLALGDYAKARDAAQHVLSIDPHSDYQSLTIPLSYLLEGQAQRALDLANRMTDDDDKLFLTALCEQALGHGDAAGAAATRFIAQHSDEPHAVAELLAFRGDVGGALAALRRARAAHHDVRDVRYDPLLKGLRADSGYLQLLADWKIPD